ncbi:MAG: glycosyltransferase family 4 protein [Candidatus Eisenbacteria bacterium]|uniref:Glycosyltransferase family 4 protein n=1 Tax=Eiseniibacteriota bacterium TaxID=2212470 RepID=A0A849SGT0_UNCEI|nr:glycosyltransferase family 4 protein [Candidatus Eisenbacteria bacterium]
MSPPAGLRIAYVLRAFPRLSETFILNEIVGLLDRGVDVRIYALEAVKSTVRQPAAERLRNRVTWIAATGPDRPQRAPRGLPRKQWRYWRAGIVLGRLLGEDGTQHVHAHFAGPAATTAAAAAVQARLPFTFTAHAKDIFSWSVDWTWVRELARRAAAVITVCDYNRRFLMRRLGPGSRVVRVYNGVSLSDWRPAPGTRTIASQALSAPRSGSRSSAKPLRVVAVGRLVSKKGFHVLIEALGQLRDRGTAARLALIGEGAELERLRALARELRLGRVVRFCGPLPEPAVRRWLQVSDVLALPCVTDRDGNQDALPTVLLEAGACGLPVVSTPVAGIPEIVHHGHTGLLVPSDDARALARALAQLARAPRRRERFGNRARAHISSRFDRRQTIAALLQVFSLAGHSGDRSHAKRAALS